MIVMLEDADGNLHTQALPPGYGWYLPSKWKTHEHVRHRQDFELPEDLPPGRYDLGYLFIDEESGEVILPKKLDPEAPSRGVQGSVWFPNAVEISTRAKATEEAAASAATKLARGVLRPH